MLLAESPSVDIDQEVGVAGNAVLDTALDFAEAELTNPEDASLYPDMDLADLLNLQTNNDTIQNPSSGWSPSNRRKTHFMDWTGQIEQAASPFNVSIPTLPTHTPRSFVLRTKVRRDASRTANLILHMLKAYPLMLQDNSLPPFIHPSLISSDAENDDMEPLNNCISLVHMLSSRVRGSRKLFWRNVRMECERLCAEVGGVLLPRPEVLEANGSLQHLELNEWELLAAMQALSIYILIRLDEGETDHNNIDSLLIATVIVGLSSL